METKALNVFHVCPVAHVNIGLSYLASTNVCDGCLFINAVVSVLSINCYRVSVSAAYYIGVLTHPGRVSNIYKF